MSGIEQKGVASAVEDVKTQNISESIDRDLERRLLWKMDTRILPILFVLFLLSFMDRINIGNAKIQNMTLDLHMVGNDYNVALFIFFIPYILCEVPSNVILKKVAPSTWLSGIMFCWGIVTIGQGLTRSYGGLVACRFLLGIFEAGFVPGCIYLISMYYKRHELQWRLNLFFCASITASAVSGFLAYAINNMNGVGGYAGWRWIFIIEGLVTAVLACLSKFVIVDWPETAGFLTEEERTLLIARLVADVGEAKMNRLDKPAMKRSLLDPKIWLAIVVLFAAIASDKLRHRFGFVLLVCVITTVGYVILLCERSVSIPVRYFALYLITGVGYMTQPIVIGWLSNSMAGHYKRSIASAMQIGLGNCGGLVAANVFIISEAPYYPIGYGVSLGMVWLCGISSLIFLWILVRENRLRDEGKRDYRYQLPREEVKNLGDDHPSFRFTY